MPRHIFSASVVHEDEWYVAQCLKVDVASQGATEAEALANLREALELSFEEPRPTAAGADRIYVSRGAKIAYRRDEPGRENPDDWLYPQER